VKKALSCVLLALLCLLAFGGQTRVVVKPTDVVAVQCDQERKLDKEYTISNDGYIVMQFVGAIQVAGLTEEAAGAKIESALVTQRILPEARVHLHVVNSTSSGIVYAGAIRNNGEMPARRGLRLADVVTTAQPNPNANMERVRIVTSSGNEFIVNYKSYDGTNNANNPELRTGDMVLFDHVNGPPTQTPVRPTHPVVQQPNPPGQPPYQPSGQPANNPQNPDPNWHNPSGKPRMVTVIGAVASPRSVSWHEGMSVSEAIDQAGGLLKTADTSNVKIQRKIDGNTRIYKEDVKAASEGLSGEVMLRPDDVIDVPTVSHHGGISRNMKIGAAILLGLVLLAH